jgi:hypothetical protein
LFLRRRGKGAVRTPEPAARPSAGSGDRSRDPDGDANLDTPAFGMPVPGVEDARTVQSAAPVAARGPEDARDHAEGHSEEFAEDFAEDYARDRAQADLSAPHSAMQGLTPLQPVSQWPGSAPPPGQPPVPPHAPPRAPKHAPRIVRAPGFDEGPPWFGRQT